MLPPTPGRTRAVRAALLVFPLLPSTGHAQRWQVDVGATSIGYDTARSLAAASLAPQIEWHRRSLYTVLSGDLTALEGSTWTAQGWSDLSFVTRAMGPGDRLRLEGATSLGGSVHSGGYRTASTRGELRAHVGAANAGFWLGGVAATGWTTSNGAIATAFGPTAGGWLRQRPVTATLIWSPLRYRGYWFQEVHSRASVSHGLADVVAYAGWRSAPAGSGLDPETWAGASIALWVARRAAVVLAGGSYASDLLQVLPRGRYVSIALRVTDSRPVVWAPSWTGRTIYSPESGEGEIRFRVPGATRVEVAGDWTGWRPVALERAPDGRWILRTRLGSGVYRFNLVVDGARWIVPDGVAVVDDGFGGKAGVLVVP